MEIVSITLPDYVQQVLDCLTTAGYEAFVVGGCVRDSLLGRVPGDWDITTSALPDEVKSLFPRTIETGIQHGTVTVLQEGWALEITTYRTEGAYLDFRKPSEVAFTRNLAEDLRRRDFTMNAIAYNSSEGIVDPFGGRQDIKDGIIRCVGIADERFGEDALRMLRAVRFACQLDFALETDTEASIRKNAPLITRISRERVRDELNKMLLSDHPLRFLQLEETGLLKHVLPEFSACLYVEQNNPYHLYTAGEHCIRAAANTRKDPLLRWTLLLHDIGKLYTKTTDPDGIDHFYGHPDKSAVLAGKILRGLRMDSKFIERVCLLILHHDRQLGDSEKSVRKCVRSVGEELFPLLLEVKEADISAQMPEHPPRRLMELGRIVSLFEHIKREEQCVSLRQLALNGRDLLEAGFPEGRAIGRILDRLLDRVIEQPELNRKDILLELARQGDGYDGV